MIKKKKKKLQKLDNQVKLCSFSPGNVHLEILVTLWK